MACQQALYFKLMYPPIALEKLEYPSTVFETTYAQTTPLLLNKEHRVASLLCKKNDVQNLMFHISNFSKKEYCIVLTTKIFVPDNKLKFNNNTKLLVSLNKF